MIPKTKRKLNIFFYCVPLFFNGAIFSRLWYCMIYEILFDHDHTSIPIHCHYHLYIVIHRQEYLEQQKKLEEEQRVEKERVEKEKLESLKKKEKHEQSAIASSEVKQRLQEFVLSKKQREAAAANSANNSPPSNTRNW